MRIASLLNSLETPAFVYDEAEVGRVLDVVGSLRLATGCRVLYSVKPLCLPQLLQFMAPSLDGFAVSSPFEARLVRSAVANFGSLHFTSPGIREQDITDLAGLCDYVAFNSLGQWRRYQDAFGGNTQRGLRVNPGLSFLDDERYDPCRQHSKLGVELEQLSSLSLGEELWPQRPGASDVLHELDGILVHSNCESTDFTELERSVARLTQEMPELLGRIRWINLGGGYLFNEGCDLNPIHRAIDTLQTGFGLEVFIEPGAAFVRSAACIVSTVLDVFSTQGREIAVLDTSINHMPEIMEFDFEPDVAGHVDDGEWEYILAGCTCLAGDIFGEYRFRQPLTVGSRVVFQNVGSYTLAKAHMFNGVNMPGIYALSETGTLSVVKRYCYEEFASRWSDNAGSPV